MNSGISEEGDHVVQGTSVDAATSRDSAARLGYIVDPFIKHFVRHPQRRAPLINRGTYARFTGVQQTLQHFVKAAPMGQVVVLGSGLDTSYFLLANRGLRAHRYYEIDFAEVNAKKASTIYKKPDLRSLLPQDIKVAAGGSELHSSGYCLMSGDLRRFREEVVPKMQEHGFDPEAPTLFVSECVLIYLDPEHLDNILDWITE
ncbi:carboxy methyl transferase for protein phosphatase 2A, partial [Coemansia interrupta]